MEIKKINKKMGFWILRNIRKNEFKLNIKRLQIFIRAKYLPL